MKGGRRTPLSCAKHLPTNRLIVSTGSLYGKSKVHEYLAVACPLGDGQWELVFPGYRKTVTVDEDGRTKYGIAKVEPAVSPYQPDLQNKERNSVLATRVCDMVERRGGKVVPNALVLDANPFDKNSSAQAIAPYVAHVHVAERDRATAAWHLSQWAALSYTERQRIIPYYHEADSLFASRTKFGVVYVDGMTPDAQLASMILGRGPKDYDAMPGGGVFMYTVNTRSGRAHVTDVQEKVKKAITKNGGRDVMYIIRGGSTIITSIATIPADRPAH